MAPINYEPISPLERLNSAVIRYPRFKILHEEIARCQRMSQIAGEPHCISLEGATGTGKTTLIENYMQMYQPHETQNGVEIPLFYMMTPSPVTVKGMASAMLEQLGDPGYYRGSLPSMNSRLIYYIQECKIRYVILDDFQYLINSDTDRVLDSVSDWLKVLIKQTRVPFMVVGVPGKVTRILDKNPQLSRLFAARETLEPFQWKTTDDHAAFNKFVLLATQSAQMELSPEVSRVDLLGRIYYASNGVVGNVMNLIRYAATLATDEGTTIIEMRMFSQAFEKRLAKHVKKAINPFSQSLKTRFTPPDLD